MLITVGETEKRPGREALLILYAVTDLFRSISYKQNPCDAVDQH